MEEIDFKQCCAIEIRKIWMLAGPMDVVRYENKCPICDHYIGLTQTSFEEANEFLEKFNLEKLPAKFDPSKIAKIKPNKEHVTKLIDFIFHEVISSGGDGDAILYTRLFDLNEIIDIVKEYNEVNNIGWEINEDKSRGSRIFSWGKYQEWVSITDSKTAFDQSPEWIQIKIIY